MQHALSREGFPDTPVMDDFNHNEIKRRYSELPLQSLVRVPSVPEEVRPMATSLALATGREIDPNAMALALMIFPLLRRSRPKICSQM